MNAKFVEMNQNELLEVEGGVASWIVFGGATVIGLGAGYAFGYFFG